MTEFSYRSRIKACAEEASKYLYCIISTCLIACGSQTGTGGYVMSYQKALADTKAIGTVEKGSAIEKAAIDRVIDFFADMSEEKVRAKVRNVYAENAYLNDNLKELHGIDQIEAYFIRSARETDTVTVEFTDVAESNGNYYFRWVMSIKFKKLKRGQTTTSIGMSHMRFDQAGKIVLHQDYWDSARGFFDHIPIVGKLLDTIRGRL